MQPRSPLRCALLGAAAAFVLAVAPAAQAQSMHRCTDGGRVYYSDRACPASGSTRITTFGPARENSYASRLPSISRLEKAPEHQTYLSAECASLSDAIRTARTRGVGYDTQSELREEYNRKCREQEREARKLLDEQESQRRKEAREQRTAQQQERAQASMTLEQCREMGRIVAERKKRYDTMTAGEKGDFERFQANFGERCRGL